MSHYTYEMIKENKFLPAFFRTVSVSSMVIPAHWHNYLEIIYLVSGKMTAVIQAETYELHPGDLLIINSEDIHMTQTHGPQTCYYLLQISSSQLKNYFPDFHLLHFDTLISQSPYGAYMEEICSIFQEKADGYPLLFSSRLHEFLFYLYRNHSAWQTSKENEQNFTQILETLDWIQNHYHEPLTLTKAAAYLGFTREYFCRLFKKYTGQTFLEYVNNIRTMRFYDELIETDEKITVLMEKHGIRNYKLFLQTFRKLYGTTPQKVRKINSI